MAVQTWCTVADIKAQLGDARGTSIYDAFMADIDEPDEFAEDLIETATDRARSYILARYEEVSAGWTAADVPKALRYAVRDIAVYTLATHRINPVAPSSTIDIWRIRYEDALEWLREVGSGDALLDIDVISGGRGGVRGRIAGAERSPAF